MAAPLVLAKAGKLLASRKAQDALAATALVGGYAIKAKGTQKQRYADPVASRGRTSKQRDR